ncbi:scaffold protein [Paenibacillus cisolokensis]|uniref:Scaffold protein n=1 Tax=Paenibacillus cisolokensis TaxID=1658519 RepID=A0ABQ4N626_9BACL|nr:phage scaffolding protein [Paenibacillus cisolokensis]GIQ63625.1 scaffold protein [Paenibacillus cisolokensis]
MDLKELLSEELYNQVMAKLGDKHKIAVVSDGSWIPKDKFNEINEAKKQAEDALKERDKQLFDLKKAAEGNEELRKQIEELQQQNKTAAEQYEAKLRDMTVTTAIKLALSGEVHDADLVLGLIDKSKIVLDDTGNVKSGLDDQVKALRESKAFLFVQKDDNGTKFKGAKPPEGSDKSGGGGQKNPWSREHFNLTEQGRILRENPELAKQLMAAAK